MPECSMCRNVYRAESLVDGVCASCRDSGAIPRRSEPTRPRIPCARCNHETLIRARLREHGVSGGDYANSIPAPMGVTFAIAQKDGWLLGRRAETVVHEPIGLLEAYICRRCGFTELYTQGAKQIPIGEAYATELFETGGDAPYR